MLVAVDCGYGSTKVLADNGHRASFPSVIAPPSDTGSVAVSASTQSQRWRVQVDDQEPVLIAHAALNSPNGTRSWDEDAAERAGYEALTYAAIRLVSPRGTVDVDLALGLPLAMYRQADLRRALRQKFNGRTVRVTLSGYEPVEFRLRRVAVYPQGAGVWYAATAYDPLLKDVPLGIVDIGYRTTDFLVMQIGPSGGIEPRDDMADSAEIGVSDIYEHVATKLQPMLGHPISLQRVEAFDLWNNRKMVLHGEPFDLSDLMADGAKTVAQRIQAEVGRAWKDEMGLLGGVVLAGGGAGWVQPHLRWRGTRSILLDQPEYANAAGFLAILAAMCAR